MTTTVGSGPVRVLALHGWFGSARGWGFLPELVDRERQTWAFPDYRGYGYRKGVAGAHTIAEIAADALAVADELGWDRFAVVGHSMGGSAAQHLLADAPGRVTHLIGISPVPASGVPFDEQGWALFSGAADSVEHRRTIVDLVTGGRLAPRWVDALVRENLATSDSGAFGAYLRAWARTDFAARLAGNPVPALAIVGVHDPAISAQVIAATWLPLYPQGRLEVLGEAGHYAMYETPVRLISLIDAFLSASDGHGT
ncbi:alpha/beta fold hydrolase [Actinoplanes sp. RD1]|uniref:alpha/beta fold hydrolase n=1 Tax=Actinoplanes sp. RD1 TaxID=3064538 RepID=UPI0027425A32|nr:alpha/beta fold hydrolase [Actinoplanes sp. RD1]